MTPDNELPVWPFLPNWREPITERLSWATVVMSSDSGAEQRYSSRLSPRREFEALFHPTREVRTFFDLFISALGGQEMMIPLWHDRHKLTAAIEDGDNRIDCDTQYGEFMDGGMAILIGVDPWSHKVVQIDEVDADGFTVVDPVDFDWPSGAVIHPLRRSRIDLEPSMNLVTDSVGEITLRFILNQANDLPDNGAWDGVTLDGLPVLTISSNFSQPVEFSYSRIMETEDNGTGLTYIRDIAERAFRSKSHTWLLDGREQNWEFRQFLYRMAGRRSPVWMPTGASDMRVSVQADAAANSVQVRKVGLAYVGGPQPGRDRFLVRTAEGYQARRITGLGVPLTDSFERLNLSANLTYALPVGTELSFLEIMRADGDDIELLHYADTEGATECSINFRGFSDTRDPSGTNFLSLPSGEANPFGCGEMAEGDDNPCAPTLFDGVYFKLIFNWNVPLNGSTAQCACQPDDSDGQIGGQQPNGPGGKIIPGNWYNQPDIYENIVPGNPLLQGQLLFKTYVDPLDIRTYIWDFYFPIDPTGDWTAITQFGAFTISANTPARFSMVEFLQTGNAEAVVLQTQNVGPLFPDYWGWTVA